MKLITLTCPTCGAQMEVNPEREAIICNYCGNKMLIDREVVEQKITGGFEFGYQYLLIHFTYPALPTTSERSKCRLYPRPW